MDINLSDFNLADSDLFNSDIELIKTKFNDTEKHFSDIKTIDSLLNHRQKNYTQNIAVEDNTGKYTYAQLESDSNRLAHFLRSRGAISETPIAIHVEPSYWACVCFYAATKAGACYLPIETSFPFKRKKEIFLQANPKFILFQKKYISDTNRLQWECNSVKTILCLDSEDFHSEIEQSGELMKQSLWDYIGESAKNQISGGAWFSSYTGNELSANEMNEYSENILTKLKPYLSAQKTVLEIGCSSGISLMKIAPHVAEYYGTDLSSKIIENLRYTLKNRKDISEVKLFALAAHQISELPRKKFDIIIINSVIQAFAGYNYLRNVIKTAEKILTDDGIIFCGDIQDLEKKQDLLEDLRLFKSQDTKNKYSTKMDWHKELFVPFTFFKDLESEISSVKSVTKSTKLGTLDNELTKFRYDVILEFDKKIAKQKITNKTKYQFDIKALDEFESSLPSTIHNSSNCAYILFTSGSSGKPKGVVIQHSAICNFVFSVSEIFNNQINSNDVFLALTSLSFDVSLFEICTALSFGAKLVIHNKNQSFDISKISQDIAEKKITTTYIPPSILEEVAEELAGKDLKLNKLLVGVEPIKPEILECFTRLNSEMQIVNGYGPTEATICATFWAYVPDIETEFVPIGAPLSNCKIFILDENDEILPIGVTGEICIAGMGIARQYLGNSAETQSRFFNPFWDKELRLYKTGDLAFWQPDGNIIFVGRNDNQVKIRGHRIETKEIDIRLEGHHSIQQAITVVNKNAEISELVSYFTQNQNVTEISTPKLKAWISLEKPEYMIPTYFVKLEQFPLNMSGKIDKNKLPKPVLTSDSQEIVAPQTPLEQHLANIWEDVLQIKIKSIDDNFFVLGGHSLKATKVGIRIQKQLNTAVSIQEIFKYASIRELAKLIAQKIPAEISKIELLPDQPNYELSHAQRRMFILQSLDKKDSTYNQIINAKLTGELNLNKLEKAFELLIQRHESFRTSVVIDNDKPKQIVKNTCDSDFTILDFTNKSNKEININAIIDEFAQKPFNLERSPLLKVQIIRTSQKTWYLTIVMHHIISDGWSIGLILNELSEFYRNGLDSFETLNFGYKDFAAWQNKIITEMPEAKAFWHNSLSGELGHVDLPADFPRPIEKSNEGDIITFEFPKSTTAKIKEISKQHQASLFVFLETLIKIFIYKYTNIQDITIGTPVSGRNHADLEKQVGLFVNTLPLRTKLSGDKSFIELIRKISNHTVKAFDFQSYPLDLMIDELEVERRTDRSPIFDIMVALQNNEITSPYFAGITIEEIGRKHITSKFDITFSFYEFDNQLKLNIEYCTNLFSARRINSFFTHLLNLTNEIVENPFQKISKFSLLSYNVKNELITKIQGKNISLPENCNLVQMFDSQVVKSPNAIALKYNGIHLSYAELRQLSINIAKIIAQKKPDNSEIIGFISDPNEIAIATILGILRNGSAYMPISPDFPTSRIKLMMESAGCKVLTTDIIRDNLNEINDESIILIDNKNVANVKCSEFSSEANNYASVIFTSGTTGVPKGLKFKQKSIINVLQWFGKQYDIQNAINVAQLSNFIFDPSIEQIFGTLIHGATICIPDKNTFASSENFTNYINSNEIQVVNTVPTVIREFISQNEVMPTLRTIISGGDILDNNLKNSILEKNYELYNHYGPTETTIEVLFEKCSINSPVTIGLPIDNTQIYILDNDLNLLPPKVVGEICIAGVGVVGQYINNEMVNNSSFVESPFDKNSIIYRTGDTGYIDDFGKIVFCKRNDEQVKINGYRVELQEIKSQLYEIGVFSDIEVVAIENSDKQKTISAFCVTNSGKKSSEEWVRNKLSMVLPPYMLPSQYIFAKKLPKKQNGKTDFDKLRLLQTNEKTKSLGVVNKELKYVWYDVLNRYPNDSNANFFHSGGNSLKAIQLVSRLRKVFNCEIRLYDVFKNPTISTLQKFLGLATTQKFTKIPRIKSQKLNKLSFAQERLWIFQKLHPESYAYNIPSAIWLLGKLDTTLLSEAFLRVSERHEIMRTRFTEQDDVPFQEIASKSESFCELVDYGRKLSKSEIQNKVYEITNLPFDLSKTSLFRARIIKCDDNKYLLVFCIHHIICDGWSLRQLIQEVANYYNTGKLPQPENIKYVDFAEWQITDLKKRESEYKKFWRNQLQMPIPVAQLPTDFKRPLYKTFAGDRIIIELEENFLVRAKQLAISQETSLFTILLAVTNLWLARISNQTEFISGVPVSGRQHIDTEDVIGCFVNSIPICTKFSFSDSFLKIVNEVRNQMEQVLEYQDYPFDKLVQDLFPEKPSDRHPVFDVMVSLQNFDKQDFTINQMKTNEFHFENNTSKFDLSFTFSENDKTLSLALEYNSDLFKSSTIDTLLDSYKYFIDETIWNAHSKISEIALCSDNCKAHILNTLSANRPPETTSGNIINIFEEIADKYPNEKAVVFGVKTLLYSELKAKAKKIAALIIRTQQSAKRVAICMQRNELLIASILGCLYSGCAYVPIDSALPAKRIQYMLEDCRAGVILTDTQSTENLPQNNVNRILISENLVNNISENQYFTPSKEAYVIYTSGTTGVPKGVSISQQSVVNLIESLETRIFAKYPETKNVALMASVSFDASVQQIFSTLLNGRTLFVVPDETKLNAQSLVEFLSDNFIEISDGTPSLLEVLITGYQLVSGIQTPKHLIIGGEPLPTRQIKRFYEIDVTQNTTISNVYGPTETTVDVTEFFLNRNSKILQEIVPIGTPLSNAQILILSADLQLIPPLVYGEILIGGNTLSTGYVGEGKLHSNKFVSNPFNPAERLYRTGDYGRWLNDGTIEFYGRKDEQVKVSGFRIELSDIEENMRNIPEIRNATVVAVGENENSTLIGFYISDIEEYNDDRLHNELVNILPHYMIPNRYIKINKIPLTNSGKIDKKKLLIVASTTQNEYTEFSENQSNTETKLLKLWSVLLNNNNIKITDNFFRIGGNSLQAIRLVGQIWQQFSVKIQFKDVFTTPTVAALAQIISTSNTYSYSNIEPLPKQEYYELSATQKRIWILSQFESERNAYNIPMAFWVSTNFLVGKLERALSAIIEKYDVFRTSFQLVNGEPVAKLLDFLKIEIQQIFCDNSSIQATIKQAIKHEFNLNKPPLLVVKLIIPKTGRKILLINTHHIISDAVSVEILLSEIQEYFVENRLKPYAFTRYVDFANWHNNELRGELFENKKQFWLNELSGEISMLEFPYDYNRKSYKTFAGKTLKSTIKSVVLNQIKRKTKELDCSIFMYLHAVLKVFLYRYSHQNQIIIGTPVEGRTHPSVEKTIGAFINTIALRSNVLGDVPFSDFLKLSNRQTADCFSNQDFPFDKVVDLLNVERDLSRSAIFDVLMVFHDYSKTHRQNTDFESVKIENSFAKFDMTFTFGVSNNDITFWFNFNTDLLSESRAALIINHFNLLLSSTLTCFDSKIDDLEILIPSEKIQAIPKPAFIFDFKEDENLVSLFDIQAAQTPDNIAIEDEFGAITYQELRKKTLSLASHLLKIGTTDNQFIPVITDENRYLVIAIISTLRVGAAYVPIDKSHPLERKEFIFKDCSAKTVLCHENEIEKYRLSYNAISFISVDGSYREQYSCSFPKMHPENFAYLIYTSGSSGNPKGVVIKHYSVVNLIRNLDFVQYTKLNTPVKVALLVNYIFDMSVHQIFAPILSGNILTIPGETIRKSPQQLYDFLCDSKTNFIKLTPSLFSVLFQNKQKKHTSLKRILLGGEALSISHLQSFYSNIPNANSVVISNVYGPTEATIDATSYEITGQEKGKIPIGKALAGYQIFILDESGHDVPDGVFGEICISGKGLAWGYLNRQHLTNKQFTAHNRNLETRIYRTGDIGRRNLNGDIEYLGRNDSQIKINGYRIEIGEIENCVLQHPFILNCCVLLQDKDLYCYYTLYAEKVLKISSLKTYIATKLPSYLTPTNFVEINEFPLTSNGKIDKRELTQIKSMDKEYVVDKELSTSQLTMINAWKMVLPNSSIKLNDNFFAIGGNSLKAMQLISYIQKEFDVALPITSLFECPTPIQLLERLAVANKDEKITPICLYECNGKRIFSFPPIIGYGAIYHEFAKLVGSSFYAFNFVDSESFIEDVCSYISKISKTEDIYLVGYSAGGNLAFEIAKQLEDRGINIKSLILLDAIPRQKSSTLNYTISEELIENYLNQIGYQGERQVIRKQIAQKSEAYNQFLNKIEYNGKVKTRIKLITSAGNSGIFNCWKNYSMQANFNFEGFGAHDKMFVNPNLKKNAEMLTSFLDKI